MDGGRRRGGRVKGEGRTGLEGGGEDVFKLLYASEYNVYVGIYRNTVKVCSATHSSHWLMVSFSYSMHSLNATMRSPLREKSPGR